MILGIDVGTTAVKAILLDREIQIIGEGSCPHDLHSPRPGWAEEDPAAWWEGAVKAIRQALSGHDPRNIQGIGISGMVPAVVLLDSHGRVIRPSIQQNDTRAIEEICELRACFSEKALFKVTGATWNQQLVGPKLLWIKRNEPDVWKQIHHVIGSYEYVAQRLTGVAYCEANWALESGLWDPIERRWITELLEIVGLDPHWLPPVRRSDEQIGVVTEEAAAKTGIPKGVPVIAGSADHIASMLPVGAIRPGQAVVKLGGAGDLLVTVDAFRPVEKLYIDYHCIPDLYVVNGCMATSGSVLKWFTHELASDRSFTDLDRAAESVPSGSEGLITLPYFLGEKTPIHDAHARGTLIGLTLSHRAEHVYRSILEGVAFAFRHHFDVLALANHRIEDVSVIDGGARSDLWCRILASVLGRPVERPPSAHLGSAMGVAIVAGVGVGAWNWDTEWEGMGTRDVFEPDLGEARTYRNLYDIYRQTYEQLRLLYPRLAES